MRKKALLAVVIAATSLLVAASVYWFFIAPNHWASGVDEAGQGLDEAGHPWLGAKNPRLVIHEFMDYDCPHCAHAHRLLRAAMVPRLDDVRLVRHDYARMKCVPNDAVKRINRCEMVRAAICASKSVSFWAWNDKVIAHPRSEGTLKEYRTFVPRLRESFDIPAAPFEKCLFDDRTIERAQAVYDEARRLKIRSTPIYMIDDQKVDFEEVLRRIKAL